MIHSNYLQRLFDPARFQETIDDAITSLSSLEFDSIAVTGTSGLCFGGALSIALGKPLIVVRKKGEDSHSRFTPVEGNLLAHRYVFVDDQVSSGDTRRRVRRAVEKFNPQSVFIGTYVYNDDEFTSAEEDEAKAASRWDYRSSKKKDDAIYDNWGNLDRYVTTSEVEVAPVPPPKIESVLPDVSVDVTTAIEGSPSFSDDPTVTRKDSERDPPSPPSQSELYNTAAFSRGG